MLTIKEIDTLKKVLKVAGLVLAVIIMAAVSYVIYVFAAYHRIGDTPLDVGGSPRETIAESDKEYSIVSYNIGFGAYEADYGFFMDGGHESWAWSKERLDANLKKIAKMLKAQGADIYLIQEVDTCSTRTYKTDERPYLTEEIGYSHSFAQNYDSPFLFYPLYQPHGASRSGIMTLSAFEIKKAERIELPVESGVIKLLDLDRCYSKNRIDSGDGAELVLYNFHLSAYTSDGTIATEQLKMLIEDIEKEYAAGNYCIAGGDFNKDILGNSEFYFGAPEKEYTWGQPIPEGMFEGTHIRVVAPVDTEKPVPSCRNADSAYHKGQYVLTVDGFLVTDNVSVISSEVVDTSFAFSDHNPVRMYFTLHK